MEHPADIVSAAESIAASESDKFVAPSDDELTLEALLEHIGDTAWLDSLTTDLPRLCEQDVLAAQIPEPVVPAEIPLPFTPAFMRSYDMRGEIVVPTCDMIKANSDRQTQIYEAESKKEWQNKTAVPIITKIMLFDKRQLYPVGTYSPIPDDEQIYLKLMVSSDVTTWVTLSAAPDPETLTRPMFRASWRDLRQTYSQFAKLIPEKPCDGKVINTMIPLEALSVIIESSRCGPILMNVGNAPEIVRHLHMCGHATMHSRCIPDLIPWRHNWKVVAKNARQPIYARQFTDAETHPAGSVLMPTAHKCANIWFELSEHAKLVDDPYAKACRSVATLYMLTSHSVYPPMHLYMYVATFDKFLRYIDLDQQFWASVTSSSSSKLGVDVIKKLKTIMIAEWHANAHLRRLPHNATNMDGLVGIAPDCRPSSIQVKSASIAIVSIANSDSASTHEAIKFDVPEVDPGALPNIELTVCASPPSSRKRVRRHPKISDGTAGMVASTSSGATTNTAAKTKTDHDARPPAGKRAKKVMSGQQNSRRNTDQDDGEYVTRSRTTIIPRTIVTRHAGKSPTRIMPPETKASTSQDITL